MQWTVFYRTKDCPVCRINRRNKMFRKDFLFIEESFEREGYRLISTEYSNAFTRLIYICPNGHEHSIRWNDWQQGIRCPYCSHSVSSGESEVTEFLKLYFDTVISRDRKIVSPYELDIVIPLKKLAIEYCGLYWHSEKSNKDRSYIRIM